MGYRLCGCLFAYYAVVAALWKVRIDAANLLYLRNDRGDREGLLGYALSSMVLASNFNFVGTQQSPRGSASVAFRLDTGSADSCWLHNRSRIDAGRIESS